MSITEPHMPLRRIAAACLFVALTLALLASACSAPTTTPAPTAAPTAAPVATAIFGLTLPFSKEANTGARPAYLTIDDVPIMGFYLNPGGAVLAPHEASTVEVMLVTEPTALLSEGGIVMNFIHPAGFATQLYLWHGEVVQPMKDGGYHDITLTPQQSVLQYGPVDRGQIVGFAGEPFPQAKFKGASLLVTLATKDSLYVPPDSLWLYGRPQYIATPTPEK